MRTSRIASLRSQRGQALVETALVLPLLVLLLFGIVEFARAFNYWNDLNQLAGEGARYAAVNHTPGPGNLNLNQALRAQADAAELRNDPGLVCIAIPNNSAGEPVTVKTRHVYALLPLFGASVTLKGSATMRLETKATAATMTWGASCP